MIPKHFKNAFPWIVKPISNIKVSSSDTVWLEREIVRIIFNPIEEPQDAQDDHRLMLINSLKTQCYDEAIQVSYISAVAKCLAGAVIETPLPKNTQNWLSDVNKQAKNLMLSLKEVHKKNLPSHWSNLFSLNIDLLNDNQLLESPQKLKLKNALKEASRNGVISKIEAENHGKLDLVAILNLLSKQSKELAGKRAIEFYKYPQTFFNEISADNTLYLSYQRSAIQAIALLNQTQFNKPFDALTSHILTCVFQKEISKQSVKKIREKLDFKSE